MNRLATMSAPGSTCSGLSWSYDQWGNRTAQTVTGGTCGSSQLTFNSYNHVTNSGFQYDAAGNMTHDASHSYTGACPERSRRDAENRLTQVDGGSTATYTYDAQGRRISKIIGGVETDYLYDLSGHVVETYGGGCGSTCLNTAFMYSNGHLLAEYTSGTTYFVIGDHLGSTRLLTNLSGGVVDSLDYLPFGEQIAGGSASTHKFTGYERDAESNLDNAQARYNSSSLGRFMSPDPGNAGADPTNPQSWNMYSYVQNNPPSFTDPTGLDCVYLDNNGGTKSGGPGGASIDHDSGEDECHDTQGNWIDGTVASLNDVYADSNSNWVIGYNVARQEWADCQGSGDCSTGAFAAFGGTTQTVTVNANDSPDQQLEPSAQQTLGGVERDTYGFNKVVTCVSSVAMPFIPAPNPDDLSGALLDNGSKAAETAASKAAGAANRIKGASRIGPARAAHIARLEREVKAASRAGKALDAAGTVLAVPEAYQNFKNNCAQ